MVRNTSSSRPSSVWISSSCQPSLRSRASAIAAGECRAAAPSCPDRPALRRARRRSPMISTRRRRRHLRQALEQRLGYASCEQVHRARHFGARLQLGRRAVRHDAPAVDDDDARAHGLDFFQYVRREDDRLVRAHALDEIAHLVLLVGVQPVGGLIEDQHVGVVDQRLGEAGAVLVAFRQRVDRLVEHVFEKAQLDCAVHRALAGVAAKTAQLGREIEEATHRHVGVARRVFRQVARSGAWPRSDPRRRRGRRR